VIALTHAVCCALRLARFNAQIDVTEQPRKAAGFFTGVPAPAGAALALLPLMLWMATGLAAFQLTFVVAPWTIVTALLMISDLPTYGWSSFRLRREYRLPALLLIALLGTALFVSPWATLSVLGLGYALMIPFAVRSYARVRQRRAAERLPA
jgi:CDP-diacylglycerol--serine O-phosphatidyltransferase